MADSTGPDLPSKAAAGAPSGAEGGAARSAAAIAAERSAELLQGTQRTLQHSLEGGSPHGLHRATRHSRTGACGSAIKRCCEGTPSYDAMDAPPLSPLPSPTAVKLGSQRLAAMIKARTASQGAGTGEGAASGAATNTAAALTTKLRTTATECASLCGLCERAVWCRASTAVRAPPANTVCRCACHRRRAACH